MSRAVKQMEVVLTDHQLSNVRSYPSIVLT
jgi:hypothetical protein